MEIYSYELFFKEGLAEETVTASEKEGQDEEESTRYYESALSEFDKAG